MPETIRCRICGQRIRVKSLEDGMSKLRRHRKNNHPNAHRRSVLKALATRRSRRR